MMFGIGSSGFSAEVALISASAVTHRGGQGKSGYQHVIEGRSPGLQQIPGD